MTNLKFPQLTLVVKIKKEGRRKVTLCFPFFNCKKKQNNFLQFNTKGQPFVKV